MAINEKLTEPQKASPRLLAVANFFSILGHPLLLLPVTVALTLIGNLPPARLFAVVAIFTASTIIPMLFIIRRRVARGTWTNMDVSEHSQRGGLYRVALPIIALSIILFWWLNLPRGMIVGGVVSLVLLLAGMLINRYSKISMHAMLGSYCLVILVATNLVFGAAGLVLVGAMSWSRVVLGRHTVAQVMAGTFLGAAAGGVLLWLLR